jgi:citrate lyase subunit gamma (acyl carrier protein)
MDIIKSATAGTLESCDAAVTVEALEPGTPSSGGSLEIVVESADKRFAGRVREVATAALAELGVVSARVTIRDRSALDCTIRARVQTACLRGAGRDASAKLPWEYLK